MSPFVPQRRRSNPSFLAFVFLSATSVLFFVQDFLQMARLDEPDRSTSDLLASGAVAKIELELPQAKSKSKPKPENSDTKPFVKSRPVHHTSIDMSRPIRNDIILPDDYIYKKTGDRWDAAPIVVESHKLVFFTIPKVGCTVWKQLFRRMAGEEDWKSQDYNRMLPHNPAENGLKYLYDYSIEEASAIMTSPEWTRAIMVREPKQRFLSAFLDKAVSNDHRHIRDKCCAGASDVEQCIASAQTAAGFLKLAETCKDDHWRPQNERVDRKFWPYMDSIMHVESAADDARSLLQRVGAWEEFGKSGWATDGESSIFGNAAKTAGGHATWSTWQVWKWYTPDVELQVEEFYRGDYENPLFQFNTYDCLTCIE